MIRFSRFIVFLLVIFVIIFLISLLLPSHVTVAKSVDINATRDKVMNQIINFEQWKNWYPAFKDEEITVIKNSPNQNILSSVTLKDKNRKSVNLNLIDTNQNAINIAVESSSSTKVNYQFILIPKTNNQIQLTWNVNVSLGWLPWKKIEGILMDKFSGPQYETALENLKKSAEN